MITDDSAIGEQKKRRQTGQIKKRRQGGERFRGGANKGTGILRMESVVPRQLVKINSNNHANISRRLVFALNCCSDGKLGGVCSR